MSGASAWTLEELADGSTARFQHCIAAADVDAFAELSGDRNPLHTDDAHARRCGFGGRVVHGALLTALVSRMIGMELPGHNALLLKLDLEFPRPTFAGDTVEVVATVASTHPAQNVVALRIRVSCGEETRVRGSALVRLVTA